MLEQAQRVSIWIHAFEPQNVNTKDLVLPNELKLITEYSKRLVNSPPRVLGHATDFNQTQPLGFGGSNMASNSMLTQASFNRLNPGKPRYSPMLRSPSNIMQHGTSTVDLQSDLMNTYLNSQALETASELKHKMKEKRGSVLPRLNNVKL